MVAESRVEDGDHPEAKKTRLLRVDQIYSRKDRQIHFVKTASAAMSKAKEDRLNKADLVVRRIITKKGMVAFSEVDIKSNPLRDVLLEINRGVEGIELNKKPPMARPELLFHSRHGLSSRLEQEKANGSPDTALTTAISTALDYINEDFASRTSDLDSLLAHGEINFGLLWALFPPNCLIYTEKTPLGQPQVMVARSTSYGIDIYRRKGFYLYADAISHDGTNLGYASRTFYIQEFDGTRRIENLVFYPLSYHPDENKVRTLLRNRGQIYLKMLGVRCKAYSGAALKDHAVGEHREEEELERLRDLESNKFFDKKTRKFQSSGRIMIDASAFGMQNGDSVLIPDMKAIVADPSRLSDDQMLMCPGTILGFSLVAKTWGAFAVYQISDTKWNADAFQKLVMEPKKRSLVYSLVKSHGRGETRFDDVIQDKGRGLIGLLSGPPGVGKTLTAEAVAEVTQRPLYMIGAGDLGKDLKDVEKRLDMVLEISTQWEAILLLDEADVFLQARTLHDLERNALVSIFLRRMEYYQGIMILTTNRVNTIDPAFQSRIHFSIQYPNLDTSGRYQVWKNFIRSFPGKPEILDEDIERLAQKVLNGRQIKNAVASAISIALEEGTDLAVQHLDTVLEALAEFSQAPKE